MGILLLLELNEAETKDARLNKTLIQLLEEELYKNCVEGCDKKWLNGALDILRGNDRCKLLLSVHVQSIR